MCYNSGMSKSKTPAAETNGLPKLAAMVRLSPSSLANLEEFRRLRIARNSTAGNAEAFPEFGSMYRTEGVAMWVAWAIDRAVQDERRIVDR